MGELTNHIAAGRDYDFSTIYGAVLSAVVEVRKARESSYWDTTGVDDACLQGMRTIGFHAVMRYLPEMTRQAINAWPGVADVYSDGSVAAGEAVVADDTTNGIADTMADGEEEQVFGWALEADSGSPVTCACWLVGCI